MTATARKVRESRQGGDLVEHRVRDRADQVRGNLDAVEVAQVPRDLAGAHAARIHRDDLLVQAGKTPLILGDQLRVAASLPVARDRKVHPPGVGQHGLGAVAVAAVARLARQVVVHLGIQDPLGQSLLQPVQQAVRVKGRFRSAPARSWSRTTSGIYGGLRRAMRVSSSHHARPHTKFPTVPEQLPEVSEAMLTLAMIRLMLQRVAHPNRKRLLAS